MPSTYRALDLDFYGTLVDWLPLWADVAAQIVAARGLSISAQRFALEWRRRQRAMLGEQTFMPYKENIARALDELCASHGVPSADLEAVLFARWGEISPFPEAPTTLEALSGRASLAICSNSARDLFEACAAPFTTPFAAVLLSEETRVNKPNPDMYALALTALGGPPESILHVASSQMDVMGAERAGFDVCWINRLDEARLAEVPKPRYEIATLDELLAIVA